MLKNTVLKYSIGKMNLCISLIIFLKINRPNKKGWFMIIALGLLVPYSFEILIHNFLDLFLRLSNMEKSIYLKIEFFFKN